jgi:succinyl-diaminopimelate desuccinylase
MRIVISAEGEGAHGSTPWEGVNAAEKLWKKFEEFRENFKIDQEKWTTTVNLGYFEADGAMNVVPDHAEAGLDVRYTEEYQPEEIVSDLEDIEGLEFEVEAEDSPLRTDEENTEVQKLKEIAFEYAEARIARKTAASDMRHFSEQGVPAVVMGPRGGNIHGEDEYVEKESMEEFYRIIKEFLEYRKTI